MFFATVVSAFVMDPHDAVGGIDVKVGKAALTNGTWPYSETYHTGTDNKLTYCFSSYLFVWTDATISDEQVETFISDLVPERIVIRPRFIKTSSGIYSIKGNGEVYNYELNNGVNERIRQAILSVFNDIDDYINVQNFFVGTSQVACVAKFYESNVGGIQIRENLKVPFSGQQFSAFMDNVYEKNLNVQKDNCFLFSTPPSIILRQIIHMKSTHPINNLGQASSYNISPGNNDDNVTLMPTPTAYMNPNQKFKGPFTINYKKQPQAPASQPPVRLQLPPPLYPRDRTRWSKHEDQLVFWFVQDNGPDDFSPLSPIILRSPKKIKERWRDYISPHLKIKEWTQEEDNLLISSFHELGPKWSKISERFGDKNDIDCKNRWFKELRYKVSSSNLFKPQPDDDDDDYDQQEENERLRLQVQQLQQENERLRLQVQQQGSETCESNCNICNIA